MQAMIRDLTLKVDAMASMGSGGSRDKDKPKSKKDKRVQVENKGIIMVNNNFFVLLSSKTIVRSNTQRTRLKNFRSSTKRK